MNRISWIFVVALAIPGLALAMAVRLDGVPSTEVISPFGWWSLLIVHLLVGFPFAFFLASWIPRFSSRAWLSGGLGGLIALLSLAAGVVVGAALDQGQGGWVNRLLVRIVWCLLLQLPWCLAFADPYQFTRSWLATALALVAVVGLPGAYTYSLCKSTTAHVQKLLGQGQLARALQPLDALCAVGSPLNIGDSQPAALRFRLHEQIRQSLVFINRRLPVNPPAPLVIERARILAMLDLLDDASQQLERLASPDANALVLLATIRQQQKRFAESNDAYRSALALPGQGNEAQRARIYDGLAFNAREMGDYRTAEQLYFEAMEALPGQVAHVHFQLGRHYHLGNRPASALWHLEEAIRLAPDEYGEQSRLLIKDIRENTPGCLLRRFGP
jgi:hypothetical protein